MLPEELDEFEEERRKRRKIKSTTNVCVHVVKKSRDFVYILCALLTLETNKTVFVNDLFAIFVFKNNKFSISIKLMHKVNSVKQLFVGIKAALQTSVVANHLQRDHALQRC